MRYRYQAGDLVYEVLLERHGEGYRATIAGETYELEILDAQPGALALHLTPAQANGVLRPQVVYWGADGDVKWFSSDGCTYRLDRPQARSASRGRGALTADDVLRAPMPAQVRAVQVADGDAVEAGQTLLLLEAMKMEIKLASPRAAKVCRVLTKQGETVERDQILVELE